MNKLLSSLKENLIYAGSGEVCPFFTWTDFSEEDIFFIFPATRYLAVYIQEEGKVEFYCIVNDLDDVPSDCQRVIEKVSYDEHGGEYYLEAFFYQVSPYEIIQKFGKRHKYLLYELDLL